MAELAGQLMVYEHEAAGVKPVPALSHAGVVQLQLGDAQDTRAFLNKPWRDAIDWFKDRGVMHEDELSALLKDYAEQSVEARKLLLEQVQQRVYDGLTTALEDGHTFEQFAQALEADAPGLGISTQDTGYLQTVFRTNVQSAYGAGRHRAMSDPDVVAARPFRMIRTAGDARVGEDHVPLDGLVYRADGPLAGLKTPFRFCCRCAITSEESWDGDVVDELPPNSVHDGFGF